MVGPNKTIYIETKGYLSPRDRRKMELVKLSNPDEDIRFVFQNANNKLNKRSKTTYGEWATKKGFKWAHKQVPQEWIEELQNE
jgi:hypothetical protein